MSSDLPPLRHPGDDANAREQFAERIASAESLSLMTDFDGTVAAIRADPDAATVRPDAREALERLARQPRTTVAIVSGRAADDVRGRVDLDGVAYAGNHGMEIEAPGREFVHPEAEAASDVVDLVCAELRDALDDVDGALVENKGLTATVHYRQVDDEAAVERLRDAVRSAAARHADLRATEGKQIVELRPAVDWDKGRAVAWLLETVTADREPHPVYLGDDVTDEAAFRELDGTGTGIAVGADWEETAAEFVVDDPEAVATLLAWIADARAEKAER